MPPEQREIDFIVQKIEVHGDRIQRIGKEETLAQAVSVGASGLNVIDLDKWRTGQDESANWRVIVPRVRKGTRPRRAHADKRSGLSNGKITAIGFSDQDRKTLPASPATNGGE